MAFEGQVVEVGVSRLFLSVEMFILRRYNRRREIELYRRCVLRTKLIVLIVLIALASTVLSACANRSSVQSVNLSGITFDGISTGSELDRIDLEKYTVKTNASDQYGYNFEELSFSVDNGLVTEIKASFGALSISINGKEDCASIDDVTGVLGESYQSSWYDREQGLIQVQYFDKENGIQCAFIYDKNGKNLVWGIIQEN